MHLDTLVGQHIRMVIACLGVRSGNPTVNMLLGGMALDLADVDGGKPFGDGMVLVLVRLVL